MPIVADARGILRPKYASTFTAAGFSVGAIDFFGATCVVYSPCDTTTDNAVTAQTDVRRVPDNLDSSPTAGAVTVMQNFLEGQNVPAGWITTSLTWRTILRTVLSMCLFIQRYRGVGGPAVFVGGVTLASTFASLPVGVRQSLLKAGQDQKFDTSALSGASTLRQLLKAMGDQWGARPIMINGLSI